jgi:hypothetical protein
MGLVKLVRTMVRIEIIVSKDTWEWLMMLKLEYRQPRRLSYHKRILSSWRSLA